MTVYNGSNSDAGLGIVHPRIHYGDTQAYAHGGPVVGSSDTQAFAMYVRRGQEDGARAAARKATRRSVWRRRLARTLCALLAAALLSFGLADLLAAGIDVARHGLALAALVGGGGVLVALVFALTED